MNIPAVRDFARLPCRLRAELELGSGRRPLEAIVRNISINGAKLEGPGIELSPQSFEIFITLESGEIDRRPARVVWRARGEIGVFFTDRRTSMHTFHPPTTGALATAGDLDRPFAGTPSVL